MNISIIVFQFDVQDTVVCLLTKKTKCSILVQGLVLLAKIRTLVLGAINGLRLIFEARIDDLPNPLTEFRWVLGLLAGEDLDQWSGFTSF